MQRRHFLRATAAAAVAGIAPFATAAQTAAEPGASPRPHKFRLKYAPHFGMLEASAGKDLLNQLRFMAEAGFTALEDNNLMKRPASLQAQIGELLARLGMTMGVFVIDAGDNWKTSYTTGRKELTAAFVNACREAVETAKRVNAKPDYP